MASKIDWDLIDWDLKEDIAKKIEGYLGIAQKAGKIAAGDMAVINAVKNNKARLVIIARDISPRVLDELNKAIEKNNLPVLFYKDKLSLGLIVGKSRRGALAVTDSGLANAIIKAAEDVKP